MEHLSIDLIVHALGGECQLLHQGFIQGGGGEPGISPPKLQSPQESFTLYITIMRLINNNNCSS